MSRLFDPHAVVEAIGSAGAAGATQDVTYLRAWLHALSCVRSWPGPVDDLADAESPGWAELAHAARTCVTAEPPTVTFAVLARDEAPRICRCLDSLPEGSPALVIDTGSVDSTRELAASHARRPRVVSTPWHDDFSAARNAVRDVVTAGWVVFVDADEVLAPGHGERLVSAISALEHHPRRREVALSLTILDSTLGSPFTVPRAFRLDGDVRYEGRFHEQLVSAGSPLAAAMRLAADAWCYHDGYAPQAVVEKDKVERNASLLDLALAEDPSDVRTLLFQARDGRDHARPGRAMDALRDVLSRDRATGSPLSESGRAAAVQLMEALLVTMQPDEAASLFESLAAEVSGDEDLEILYGLATYTSALAGLRRARARLARVLQADRPGAPSDEPADRDYAYGLLGAMSMSLGDFDVATRCHLVAGAGTEPDFVGGLVDSARAAFGTPAPAGPS